MVVVARAGVATTLVNLLVAGVLLQLLLLEVVIKVEGEGAEVVVQAGAGAGGQRCLGQIVGRWMAQGFSSGRFWRTLGSH
jgi:hypothetical protein